MKKSFFVIFMTSLMTIGLASCGGSKETYTITWKDYDSSVLMTSYVKEGEVPVYPGQELTRNNDPAYEYSFSRWNPTPVAATRDTAYKAIYTKGDAKKYTITWVDGDGNTLKTEDVAYGETPSYTGITPTKASTLTSSYSFNDTWAPALSPVSGAATYVAQFNENVRQYTVTFMSDDGLTSFGTSTVDYNTSASDSEIVPTKDCDLPYQYIFAGWVTTVGGTTSDDLDNVTSDRSVYATYTKSLVTTEGFGFNYISSTTSYTLMLYSGSDTKVVVPSTYNDGTNGEQPVTKIASGVFSDKSAITDIYLSDNIVTLGTSCFKNAIGLKNIRFPETLTTCYAECFSGCTSLVDIVLPESFVNLGASAFYQCSHLKTISFGKNFVGYDGQCFNGCTSLISINVSSENTYLTSIDGCLFSASKTTMYRYPAGKTGSTYTIPSNVTTLFGSCFESSQYLTEMTVPSTIKSLGTFIFGDCKLLQKVVFQASYSSVPDYFVINCPSLTELSFDTTTAITSFGYMSLAECTNLVNISLPDALTSLSISAFWNDSSLANITFPTSLVSIGEACFLSCSSLTSLNITKNISSIGNRAFFRCSGLTSVTVDAENTHYAIQDQALYTADKATLLFLPNACSITSLVLPSTLVTIPYAGIYEVASLETLIIPSSVETIASSGVAYCSNLKSIYCYATSKPSGWNSTWTITYTSGYPVVYWYSEAQPAAGATGSYWHMVNDVPTAW